MTAINASLAANPIPATDAQIAGNGPPETLGLYSMWTAIPGELARLAKERATAEESCRTIHAARVRRADVARREAIDAANTRRDSESAELASELASIRNDATRE